MKSKKWIGALLATAMIMSSSVALVGCGKDGDDKASNDTENAKKDDDQHLNLILSSDPATLDPNEGGDTASTQIITQTQEGLARILPDEKGIDKVVPAGAESWEQSKDGLTWTFKLRKEMKWTDGKPVIAQHYVDSILRLLDPAKGFEYAFFAYDLKNGRAFYDKKAKADEVGVKAIDDYTLQLVLEKAAPHFEKKLAAPCFFPIRLDVIKAGGENWNTDFTKQVFCGPFVIKEWVKNSSMTLEKNEGYWDAKNVSLKKVEMRKIEEFSTQAQLFESQQLDVTGATTEFIDKWKKKAEKGEFKYRRGINPQTDFMVFNQKTGGPSGVMKSAKVRKALSLSIDREEFLDAMYGRFFPAYGLVPYGITIGDKEYRKNNTEPFKAEYEKYKGKNEELQKLFKEGLKELGMSDDLSKVTLKYVTTGSSAKDKAVQEYWQQMWQNKLGIKIQMEIVGDTKILSNVKKDFKYDIVYGGWHADYNDPLTFADLWLSGSSYANSYGGYGNTKYDEVFKKLDGENDLEKREKIYAELEKILTVDDAGMAPYAYRDVNAFMQNYVKDFQLPTFGPTYEFSRAYTAGRTAK